MRSMGLVVVDDLRGSIQEVSRGMFYWVTNVAVQSWFGMTLILQCHGG